MRHQQLLGLVNGAEGWTSFQVFAYTDSLSEQIFIRALDLDERLVGVAFLDVGVYVTSLRAMKNLLLIGDAIKSLWFVAFQVGQIISRYIVPC